MDEEGRNENRMENEPEWDRTYGKKSLPQVSRACDEQNVRYSAQNTFYREANRQSQNVAEQISSFGPPVQPYLPPRKSHKKTVLIAVGSLLVLLFVCVGAAWIYHINSAAYKIAKGFENMDKEMAQMRNPLSRKLDADEIARMMAEEGSHVNTRLDFTVDTGYLGDITLGIDTDYYKDVRRKELDAATSFSIMNYDFAHFNLYGDEDVVCFSIPELFLEDIYIETEDVTGQYNRSIWADPYMFGEIEEDYSINLFPDTKKMKPIHSWQDARAYLGNCSGHLEECLQGAKIEKVGKGLYRVTFDALEVNYLLRDLLQTYEDMTGQDMYDYLSYLQLVNMGDDISLLLEIDGGNLIRRILIEDPIRMLDNQISLEGEILFQGKKRSIDLLRGQLLFTRDDDAEDQLEFVWQVDQSLSSDEDEYRMEADMKCRVMDEEVNMKYTSCFDAQYDTFQMNLSMKDDWSVYVIEGEGRFGDIRAGESYSMDLEDLSVTIDGERLFKVTGDIKVEPLRGDIKRSAKAGKALFKMTEEDWYRVLDRIDEEYGSLWDLLY